MFATAACISCVIHVGLTTSPDGDGFYTYVRPEGKSGGHGVGWSEMPRYSFKVPGGWEETPVSIADLGGTEVMLRQSASEVIKRCNSWRSLAEQLRLSSASFVYRAGIDVHCDTNATTRQ